MSNPEIIEVTTLQELDDVFQESQNVAQLLFLHDPWCPVSASASKRVARLEGTVRLVDVSKRRDITRAVAERTGIRHESPQAIVLAGGEAVWDASHYEIDEGAIRGALKNVDCSRAEMKNDGLLSSSE